jgi:hypothetical protein
LENNNDLREICRFGSTVEAFISGQDPMRKVF